MNAFPGGPAPWVLRCLQAPPSPALPGFLAPPSLELHATDVTRVSLDSGGSRMEGT